MTDPLIKVENELDNIIVNGYCLHYSVMNLCIVYDIVCLVSCLRVINM